MKIFYAHFNGIDGHPSFEEIGMTKQFHRTGEWWKPSGASNYDEVHLERQLRNAITNEGLGTVAGHYFDQDVENQQCNDSSNEHSARRATFNEATSVHRLILPGVKFGYYGSPAPGNVNHDAVYKKTLNFSADRVKNNLIAQVVNRTDLCIPNCYTEDDNLDKWKAVMDWKWEECSRVVSAGITIEAYLKYVYNNTVSAFARKPIPKNFLKSQLTHLKNLGFPIAVFWEGANRSWGVKDEENQFYPAVSEWIAENPDSAQTIITPVRFEIGYFINSVGVQNSTINIVNYKQGWEVQGDTQTQAQEARITKDTYTKVLAGASAHYNEPFVRLRLDVSASSNGQNSLRDGYIQVFVSGIPSGRVATGQLQVTIRDTSIGKGEIYRFTPISGDNWDETLVTYNSPLSGTIGSELDTVVPGAVTDKLTFDVSSIVNGFTTYYVKCSSSDQLSWWSREATSVGEPVPTFTVNITPAGPEACSTQITELENQVSALTRDKNTLANEKQVLANDLESCEQDLSEAELQRDHLNEELITVCAKLVAESSKVTDLSQQLSLKIAKLSEDQLKRRIVVRQVQ